MVALGKACRLGRKRGPCLINENSASLSEYRNDEAATLPVKSVFVPHTKYFFHGKYQFFDNFSALLRNIPERWYGQETVSFRIHSHSAGY